MKIIELGVEAQAMQRHRLKKFDSFYKVAMKRRDKFRLNSIPCGQAGFYRRDEYTKAELSALRAKVSRYNREFPMQFHFTSRADGVEVARLA